MVDKVADAATRGFCKVVVEYLRAAAEGPWEGKGARTCLFGVQRTPLGGAVTVIRCGAASTWDEICPYLLPFFCTNARDAVELSVAQGSPAGAAAAGLELHGVKVRAEM